MVIIRMFNFSVYALFRRSSPDISVAIRKLSKCLPGKTVPDNFATLYIVVTGAIMVVIVIFKLMSYCEQRQGGGNAQDPNARNWTIF